MSDIKEEIFLNDFGLDTDSSLRYMTHGSSRVHRNVLVGEDESGGVITNMLGATRTVDIADHELTLSRVYKVIGSYYNRLTRRVYYFIFSQPYEVGAAGASTSTTTTTTTEEGDGALVVDYTAGDFLYDNMLLCYYEDTQLLDVIFRDPKNYFGLDIDYPMRDITMIGDWLYFNPRVSEPKMIDVTRAYNYTNYDAYDPTVEYYYGDYVTFYGGLFRANTTATFGDTPSTDTDKWDRIGDSYQNETSILTLDSEFRYAFNVIKSAPKDRIIHSYKDDNSINFNNIRNRVFKFTHRYKYFDNSYTVFSAYSDITLPVDDELYNGEVTNITQLNNYIQLQFSPFSPSLVKSIEVYFQEVGQSWRRCKIINRQEQAILDFTENFTYDFYNNESYEIYADPLQISKVQDSVPKLANAQELINKNILCYGGVTEGFDNVPKEDIDVTLTPEREALDINQTGDTILRNNIPSDISYNNNDPDVYILILAVGSWYTPGDLAVGTYYEFSFKVGTVVYSGQLELTAPMLASADALATAISNEIANKGYGDTNIDANDDIEFINYDYTYPWFTKSYYFTPIDATSKLTKYRGFKTGAFHPFCQYYYDENLRRWDAQTSKTNINTVGYAYEGTTVYVPMLNELSPLPLNNAFRWVINWEVNHLPPEGAKYWRWGYAANSLCNYFVQYIIASAVQGSDEESNMLEISIEPLQTVSNTTQATWNQFPQTKIYAYTWQKGDRIRFITQATNVVTPGMRLGDLVDGVYDYEIIKQDGEDTNLIYIQYIDPATLGLDIGVNTLVEIYSPLQATEKVEYFEFGDLMTITEDSSGVMVHNSTTSGINQNSVTGVAASGVFTAGDVYHIYRTPSKPLCTNPGEETASAFHESKWYSDFYDSDFWDQGKSGVESTFNERYLNIIRHSNPYLQNTQINGLPTFEFDSYKELNDVYGDIIAIYELGNTLKCYQERKASSIGIGRTEYMDADGKITVTNSDQLLGGVRYSPTNFSTVFPESIMRNNRYIYGFDIYNGVMWRDSANGIFPISGRYAEAGADSDYRMATWFKDKAKELLVSGIGHCDVMSVWDEEFKNLHVTFVDYEEELHNETIVFHEPSNRWICFQDLYHTPPSYNVMVECDTYTIIKGFEGGLGYSFDEDTRFAMFNIQTTGGSGQGNDLLGITIEILAPTVQLDSYPPADLQGLAVTLPTAVADISWVNNDSLSDLFTWAPTEYGFGVADTIVWSIVIHTTEFGSATLSFPSTRPSWLMIADETLHEIPTGGSITDDGTGAVMYIYPISENTGSDKNSSFTLSDAMGNSRTVTVTHYAAAELVTVSYLVSGAEFTISNWYYNAPIGSTDLYISFNHDFEGTEYKYIKVTDAALNVLYAGSGVSGGILVRLAHLSSKTMTLSRAMSSGDVLLVTIGEDDDDAIADLQYITIELLAPDPHVAMSTLSLSSITWPAIEYSYTVKAENTITTTEPSVSVTAIPEATWAIATLDPTTPAHPLIVGDTLENGDTVYLYPTSANTGAIRTTTFAISDTYGNAASSTLIQSAPLAPPTIIVLIDPLEANGMTITDGSGTGVHGSATVALAYTPHHPDWGTGDVYFTWWRAIRSGIEIGDNRITSNDDTPWSGNISLDVSLSSGQTVYIYIGSDIY